MQHTGTQSHHIFTHDAPHPPLPIRLAVLLVLQRSYARYVWHAARPYVIFGHLLFAFIICDHPPKYHVMVGGKKEKQFWGVKTLTFNA